MVDKKICIVIDMLNPYFLRTDMVWKWWIEDEMIKQEKIHFLDHVEKH